MEIFYWIIGIIGAFIIYNYFAGVKRKQAYQQILEDLIRQLAENPNQFFQPNFHLNSSSYISEQNLANIIFDKIVYLALERNIRSFVNVSLIPNDVTTIPDVKQNFEKLFMLADSIANHRR